MIKVFVAVPSTFSEEHRPFLDRIIAFFKNDQKYNLASDLQWFTKQQRKKDFFQTETQGLNNSDFLVAEISYPSVGVGFLISYAVMKKKRFYVFIKRTSIKLNRHLSHPYQKVRLQSKNMTMSLLNQSFQNILQKQSHLNYINSTLSFHKK